MHPATTVPRPIKDTTYASRHPTVPWPIKDTTYALSHHVGSDWPKPGSSVARATHTDQPPSQPLSPSLPCLLYNIFQSPKEQKQQHIIKHLFHTFFSYITWMVSLFKSHGMRDLSHYHNKQFDALKKITFNAVLTHHTQHVNLNHCQ